MDVNKWQELLHAILITIGSLGGVIAAASSLRNGKILKKNGQAGEVSATQQVPKTKITVEDRNRSGPDWYTPPDL